MVRGRGVAAGFGPVLDGLHGEAAGGGGVDGADERVGAEDVVDELSPPAVYP